jgi:hypothetical protein
MAAEAPDSPLYLEPASLSSLCDPAGSVAAPFLLTAIPGSLVDLVLADCAHVRGGIVVAHKRVGASGFCTLQPNEVVDAIRESGIGIGRFEIHDGASMAATEAWYVDIARLPSHDLDAELIAGLPGPLRNAFTIIRGVKNGTAQDIPDVQRVVPSSAKQLAILWLWTARLLDEWAVSSQAVDCLDGDNRRVLDGLSALLQRERFLEGATDAVLHAERLIKDWDQFNPQEQLKLLGISTDRWSRILKAKRDKIQWIADVERRTADAIAAVQASAPVADVPDLLKNAWRQYLLAEQFEPASAKDFLADAADHIHVAHDSMALPWSDIGQLLLPLCYLRLCLIRSFLVEVRTRPSPRYGDLAWRQLHEIADNLMGHVRSEPSATDSLGIAAISPRRDDQALERALASGPAEWLSAARGCWIGAWLGWRWSHFAGRRADEKEQFYDALLNQAVLIPQSLDRDEIMSEIESKTPGVWQ